MKKVDGYIIYSRGLSKGRRYAKISRKVNTVYTRTELTFTMNKDGKVIVTGCHTHDEYGVVSLPALEAAIRSLKATSAPDEAETEPKPKSNPEIDPEVMKLITACKHYIPKMSDGKSGCDASSHGGLTLECSVGSMHGLSLCEDYESQARKSEPETDLKIQEKISACEYRTLDMDSRKHECMAIGVQGRHPDCDAKTEEDLDNCQIVYKNIGVPNL